MLSRRAALVFGVADVLTALLVAAGVFMGLPARWAPVDVAAGLLAALKLGSGGSLLARAPWAERLATVAAAFALVVGLGLVTALALTASWLAGIYGPVGRGGALILALVAALVLPYLVVLPAVELVCLSERRLGRLLALWAIGTATACALVCAAFGLREDDAHPKVVIASLWQNGKRIRREVLSPGDRGRNIDAWPAERPGASLVYESVVADGPVLQAPEVALSLSFVPGRDGMAMTLDGRTEYLTPDDLLAHQAYDKELQVAAIGFSAGLDVPLALALFSESFGATVRELGDRASIRRIRVVRSSPGQLPRRVVSGDAMTRNDVKEGAIAAARFLARGVDAQGRFRYLVDAPTNRTLPGYDWPRHAGATYYLAQVAGLWGEPGVAAAALRAAGWMRDEVMVQCGETRCIGSGRRVDVGSTALALLAFVEIARTKLDPGYALLVPDLAAFLRGQQRPDGDFMHQYDRESLRPIDVQFLYYTGEAALALSRAHALLGDSRDLDAASRAVARLVGDGWSFFGSRYYFGEEHWTCQAMDDMWDRAPNRQALDFCLRWHAFGRKLQLSAGDTPYDAEGAYGIGPLAAPRLTPAGSRSEAGLATLDAARKAGVSSSECAALEGQMRKSLAMLLRHQVRREGPASSAHLLADPAAVEGAMPASEVDWQLRIDFAQHTGSALLKWLEVEPG
jgi:hypothetical protein